MRELNFLLVEDDIGIGRMVLGGLTAEGLKVEWARTLQDARQTLDAREIDAMILDRMLPDGDGARFCAELRSAGRDLPVLMMTALEALEDKLSGFEAGADDYLTKPFEFDELLARLRAMTRRAGRMAPGATATIALDPSAREMKIAGEAYELTEREFALIAVLHERWGKVVSREDIVNLAWRATPDTTSNAVDVYVGYLRKKLAAADAPARIETVRGRGFRLVQ